MRNAILSLENENKVFSEHNGRHKRYFPISMKEKWKPMSINAKMRETADIIKKNPGISSQDIASKRDRKRPTILYHTKKLMEMMIIKAELRNGKHLFYWTGKEYL
jgi:predicted transcriptional regulator